MCGSVADCVINTVWPVGLCLPGVCDQAGPRDHQWLDEVLPHLTGVVIERTGSGVLFWAHTKAEDGVCPSCGCRSRAGSQPGMTIGRRFGGRPTGGTRLQVRRFVCDHSDCPVHKFAEQADGLTTKRAHRTALCRMALEHIGLAMAGRAGSRLAARLGLPAGRSTYCVWCTLCPTRRWGRWRYSASTISRCVGASTRRC